MTEDLGVGVSVFAGVGGLEHGFDRAGVTTAVQVEWDAQCREVLAARYPDAVRFGDVREVDADAVRAVLGGRLLRCLYGGFPCQDVSVAGRRAGMAGGRSSLYVELVRLADALDPEWLVVENVPGLLSADVDPDANGGKECADAGGGCAHPVRPETGTPHGYGRGTAFAVVLRDITGYCPPVPDGGWRNSGVCAGPRRTVAWRVLDARHFGVAQRRRRVFLVACARDRAAPAAVLLEPEGMRGDPPPGEPPRPRFATRVARPAVRAGGGGADGDRAGGPRALTADDGVVSSLTSRMGTNTGPDTADAQAGWLVPGGQPNDEVGALTASGGPSALDDQSTTQLVVGEPTPLLEVNARTGRSTDDPECGIGIGEEGDPMYTLQAGKQHGVFAPDVAATLTAGASSEGVSAPGRRAEDDVNLVAYEDDPARPVGRRGRDDDGTMAELGDEPVMNALGTAGGGSGMPTVLAYDVNRPAEHGVANDDGVAVKEIDVAPPLLADGDPARTTDRGVRIVQAPYRKSRRAQDPTDDETWVEGDVANTLNTFDGGDVRASEVVVEAVGFAEGGTGQSVSDVAGTLTATPPSDSSSRQNVVATGFYPTGGSQGMGEGREVAQPLKVGTSDGGPAPGAVAFSEEGPPSVIPVDLKAATKSDGRTGVGTVGMGAGEDGDPAYTVTTSPTGAVATSLIEGAHGVTGDDVAGALQSGGGKPGQGYQAVATVFAVHGERGADVRDGDLSNALRVGSKGSGAHMEAVVQPAQVRRLTPLECERLQGVEDGWTDVAGAADSVRYRQLGNMVCAAVSDWLGWRIVAYVRGWRPA